MGNLAPAGPVIAADAGSEADAAPGHRPVVMGVIGLLWALALWQSWECRGLFSDGSVFFLDMIVRGDFGADLDHPRAHAIILTQVPPLLAMKLGVSDLHWLARLYSLGLFGLPTALYSFALVRAGRDDRILAVTLAAIAMVFMTTSFFIIGEYHTAYACAILAAVWLGTACGLRVWDGVVLVAVAALAVRCYQHSLYLGPLLATMTIWAMVRTSARPRLATVLYAIAAALFLAGGYVATDSLLGLYAVDEERTYLVAVVGEAANFRFNVQLGLLLATMAGLALWGVLRPGDLRRPWPFLAAGVLVLLVAVSPVLVVIKGMIAPPYSNPQVSSRTVAGPLTASFVALIWLLASNRLPGLRVLSVLKETWTARRLVVLAGAMVVATMPWNIMLTSLFKQYLEVVQATIRAQSGLIAIDDAIFERYPDLFHRDIAPSTLSVILRTSPTDGVLVNTVRNPADLSDPATPPDLGRYSWRD